PSRRPACGSAGLRLTSAGVAIGERCAHGVDRNPRYEAREEEPGDTNPDRKCARERLPWHDVAITNREAGDEGEIDRVACAAVSPLRMRHRSRPVPRTSKDCTSIPNVRPPAPG